MSEANTVTSVEQDGRTLSGVGTSVEALEAVMERHAPDDAEPAEPVAAPTPAADAAAASATAEPPQTRGQKRYAQLTRERDDAKAAAAAAQTEREALARERDELKARLSQPATPPASERPAAVEQPATPQKFTFPTYDQFLEAHPDTPYNDWELARLDAYSEWKDAKTNLDARISERLAADRAMQSLAGTIEQTRAKGREVYKDFDTILSSGPGALVPLGPSEDVARARVAFIYAHPQSEHLQYAIMKDGDLAKRLASLDDIRFGLALAQIAPSGSGVSPASPARTGSATPPAPYQPVGSGSSTTVPPSAELAKRGFDFDKSGYRERRAAERGGIRRR